MARKAKTEGADSAENAGRLKQIALTYKMTRRTDSKIGLVIAGVGIATFGVLLGIGFAIGHPVYLGILGFVLAVLAMAIVFGRRASGRRSDRWRGSRVRPPPCWTGSDAAGPPPRPWR